MSTHPCPSYDGITEYGGPCWTCSDGTGQCPLDYKEALRDPVKLTDYIQRLGALGHDTSQEEIYLTAMVVKPRPRPRSEILVVKAIVVLVVVAAWLGLAVLFARAVDDTALKVLWGGVITPALWLLGRKAIEEIG